jgi:hypothetical protein
VVTILSVQLSRADQRVRDLSAAGASAVEAALHTPGHVVIDLRTPGGVNLAEMVLLPNGQGYVVSTRLPGVGEGRTYQLWAQSGGRFISVGLLGAKPERAAFTVASTRPTALAITVEPAAGVPSPDRSPVVSGNVS